MLSAKTKSTPKPGKALTPPQKPAHRQSVPAQPKSASDYFAIVSQATNDAVRDWEVKTGALTWPQGLQRLLGYVTTAKTEKIDFWLERIHLADVGRIRESLHQALAGPDEFWTGEYRFRRADGEYLHIYERAVIVRCPDPRVVSSMMDVTARRQLLDQACRSQRMEAFGELAGGLAHDFNNFLTTILGYSDLILSENAVRGSLAGQVREIHAAANRATELTNQLLAFSRRQALEPIVLEINALIANLERSLLRLLGENISILLDLPSRKEGAHIKADAGQLTQILLNLAVNARDAMRQGGTLTIATTTRNVLPGREPKSIASEFAPGEYVVITVTDNGSGMSEEVKARLFEPFFTTKAKADRNGLGLATSYGIVKQSDGHIWVESELGCGTTFHIYLPRVAPPPAPAYKRRDPASRFTGTETILVLEDDVSVRHFLVRVLRKFGYHVLEAAHGEDAKRLIAQNRGRPIDLLLTDMVMPQISGRSFADWLGTASPETKVVFVSGYLEESMHPGDRCAPDTHFLPKPFTVDQLAGKVRAALDGN
ncbi:MAG: ATP-binding protein [Chthoniobacterales bacterium]